jgi:hypothetical protein
MAFVARWAEGQARFGVRISPYLEHICHGDSHKRGSLGARKRPAPDFCQDSHASDLGELLNTDRRKLPRVQCALRAPEHARAQPRVPRAALSAPVSPARARAYKSPTNVDRTPPRTLDLTGARNHRRLPHARRARGRPSPCHRRPANRTLPSRARPLEEIVHASVKLLEQGIGLCFAGEASPWSSDFARSPVNVDRVNLCPILRFLVHIASTSPRGAHRAI